MWHFIVSIEAIEFAPVARLMKNATRGSRQDLISGLRVRSTIELSSKFENLMAISEAGLGVSHNRRFVIDGRYSLRQGGGGTIPEHRVLSNTCQSKDMVECKI